ncbi:MAG: putative pre-16S rRNA nuclease [Chlamydiales bacterium]|nr:putative pre-16S rRNA nuclease [Chlamydiales bacterium]MCH9620454.1 putative pre-16S rRNA nuclease [Chlamydiales bacterium]MCH9623440.1 putative pre-16S rRNA nuclease [Chlamydiales bacterium]
MGRVASIDFGLKRLGVALSDPNKILATALGTVIAGKNSEETAQKLLDFLKPHDIETIIFGNPLHMNGKVSFLADEVQHFISLFEKKTSIPIRLWDERLTSLQAERTMKSAGMTRKKRAKVVDSLSAVILLQSYLSFEYNKLIVE